MAYTPPAYNAVNFNFTAKPYNPPASTAVNFNFTVGNPDYVGSGGLSFGGAASIVRTIVYVPTGGVAFTGAAAISITKRYLPSGGMQFAGTAPLALVFSYLPTGGLVFDGIVPYEFDPAGIAALVINGFSYTPTLRKRFLRLQPR